MEWSTCFTQARIGDNKERQDIRSQYTRDYDRIIFSSPFRRLQNKTQVFPLPGTSFVHNRHTHSLEVASVGRSLANIVGDHIANHRIEKKDKISYEFYKYDLSMVISAACLAHDIGNPAFGHSGEDAISEYFKSQINANIEGQSLRSFFNDHEWNDLTNFEGNANAFRILTKVYKGKSPYGMGITMSTIAAMFKYPCSSSQINKAFKHTKKYGYFQSEKPAFEQLMRTLGYIEDPKVPGAYLRHPFVLLVEAADDICYNIIDMEDAHRLGILSTDLVRDSFLQIIKDLITSKEEVDKMVYIFHKIEDSNESIAYLRSLLINTLVNQAAAIFIENEEAILRGTFNETLMGVVEKKSPGIRDLMTISIDRIYKSPSVIEVEIAGFHVMSELLGVYIPSVLKNDKNILDKSIMSMMPTQFLGEVANENPYLRVMNVIDHISSMTDAYATEHYRSLKGIEMRRHD